MNDPIKYGRKTSGIKKELRERLEAWVATIDDQELVKLIKKNTIVTGGSIASMLLGEKINDVDCYFRDYATTVAVAKYYVGKFNGAKKIEVGENVIPYMPEVKEFMGTDMVGNPQERVSIYMKSAGVAAEDQAMYKYFEMETAEAAAIFADSLRKKSEEGRPKYRPIFLSANAITLSDDIQIVIRFYGTPSEIHGSFDFRHAMCYYDWNDNDLVLPAKALECLLSRSLVYCGSAYPIATLFRMKKFIERGWRCGAGEMVKVAWQISELDLKDHKVISEQMTGVDAQYLHQFVEALKNVDSDLINSAYITTIIDRIFENM